MTVKKQTSAKKQTSTDNSINISDVSIINTSAANEHTRIAIVALAEALSRNADAIKATAEALKGSPATIGNCMFFGDTK